ncbi:MAG: hypothetical protein G01um101438_216 [Parcubacteria group bacterium Gr01-1014_38]|nr:MAG: hypothetical protein G01um101438_216 [Parcubacteria group bacterium Gr01-1014_38]
MGTVIFLALLSLPMARRRFSTRLLWKILVILVALGTIGYLALPFLAF